MSQTQLDAPVPRLPISRQVRPDVSEPACADALQSLRALSHYLPDYDYRPDRYQYTETSTTDPDYVVWEVEMMSPTQDHGASQVRLCNALEILTQAFDPRSPCWLGSGHRGHSGSFFCIGAAHLCLAARHCLVGRPRAGPLPLGLPV